MATKPTKSIKPEKPVTLAIKVPGKPARETHKVYKDKKGEIIVDHTQRKGGKFDKINLSKKAGAKNVQQGVKAVQKYHRTTGK